MRRSNLNKGAGIYVAKNINPKNNRAMIDREQLINEIAEVVNRNSMEKTFNDTPDFILARIAVEAMEMFTRASAHRDDYHGFRTADYARKHKAICESEKKAKPVNTCKGCPLTWNPIALSLLKWEIRKRYRTIGIKAPETKPGFCRLYT